jgi:hypothetical protein
MSSLLMWEVPMYRQGDVLLIPVPSLPTGARQARSEGDRIVLALGEATGHAHAIATPGVQLFERGSDRFIQVHALTAVLAHEEHGAIEIPTGTYRVVTQREYAPEEIRRVQD